MASVDMYLKLDGIDGESTAKRHEKWIEISSFSWGEANTGLSGAGGSGRTVVDDFVITKHIDAASPQLLLRCFAGNAIPTGTLSLTRKAGKVDVEYLKIQMSDCLISSFESHDHAGGEVPLEQISLNFHKMDYTYTAPGGKPITVSINNSPEG